jgi:hypothetical protein
MSDLPRYHRRVFRITAEDSPNVKLALEQKARGEEPTGEMLVPGVLPYDDYVKRRRMWDKIRQCIGLDAQFWTGTEALLFPPEWLNKAEQAHRILSASQGKKRVAKAIGVDPAEGGDLTSMSAVDELGVLACVAKKTPNTAVIKGEVLAFARLHDCPFDMIMFDRGGGGKQIADELREIGHQVKTVSFGEAPSLEPKYGINSVADRKEVKEDRTTYVSRRAQMYGELSWLMDPGEWPNPGSLMPFALPHEAYELRRQLAPIPRQYDKHGRLKLPPKRKGPGVTEKTLEEMIGCSPDEADSLVIAVHCMLHSKRRVQAGVGR